MASFNGNVTFLGVGNMGTAAIQALRKASHPVTIWNRTKSRPQVQAAIDAGATFEPDLAQALSRSGVIVLCLLDYATITKIFSSIGEPGAVLKGKSVINLTNGTPKEAREMETYFTSLGTIVYLDGAIMVTPQMVGGPHAFLFLSGGQGSTETPDGATSRLVELVSPIGKPDYLGADVGAASRYDLASLAPMYGMFAGGFLGMALLKRGNPNAKLVPVVQEKIVPMIAALVPYMTGIARAWDAEDWVENDGNPVGMMAVGVQNILAAAADEGVDGTVLEEFGGLMEKVERDHGYDAGIAAVGTYLMK
ncbi:uncharacterized protein B0I36DRAFT_343360 [Microdochium trichocladiopsis]|uniref:6-phosphogluconate dehydrogenase NADP-binding domain-containing protein n=1 Tax=Microdochium trichocladiopsis TaxID=1682393 RepID=A0A9P8XQR7_9PEZI|nr:uncharacterized protein B0I36DRAFT_343360 [Microdochium trichocladiopsis]KAH7007856.1 hypothetical protein B0I36DRAFT_343360 [Microdochium trichocladiopsis]